MKRSSFTLCRVVIVMAALGLGGCAQKSVSSGEVTAPSTLLGDTKVALRMGGAAPLTTTAGQPLFASGMTVLALDQRLTLKSDYTLRAGDLLSPADGMDWRPGKVPNSLGTQWLGQQAELRLPKLAGAPVMVKLQHEQEQQWSADSAVARQREGIGLRWSPSVAAVDVQWQGGNPPVDVRNALVCPLRSTVQVPILPVDARLALQLGGRSCDVVPLSADALPAQAQTWSAGLGWSDASRRRASLRMLVIDAEPIHAAALGQRTSAHEFGLEHEERIGAWSARAGVAWRQRDVAGEDPGAWASDARLSRDMGVMRVAAQWQSGDRYWFLPGSATLSDNLALSLDFSAWAAQRWPGYTPTLSLAYRWQRIEPGPITAGHEDGAVEWRLSLPWQ